MNNLLKTIYGLIVILFLSIIISSTILHPDYETVEANGLELSVDNIQSEYKIGENNWV